MLDSEELTDFVGTRVRFLDPEVAEVVSCLCGCNRPRLHKNPRANALRIEGSSTLRRRVPKDIPPNKLIDSVTELLSYTNDDPTPWPPCDGEDMDGTLEDCHLS